ncbi:uncharacterized protein GGS22DRAFT_199231 [Annulohypoxylon maeteangense]|uniref:uncharacterized protein n=1 Tax=Annulohypoxylon maeteangense TaxID=1927788 RepID=UPI0020087FF5|nr:uncharacterized protein GGS22DRAFT_199231 [Annulohypoxylon maeteangense]KAI0886911.1 hypothetical protein GGS22DRAFT_199231 [Annulohypoxylon maeteangense]
MPRSNTTVDVDADSRAYLAAKEAKVKDQLVAKLKENNLLSDDQMNQFKQDIVNYSQKDRIRGSQRGHDRQVRNTRRRQPNLEKEYNEISQHSFIDATVDWIEDHGPSRCIQIYEDVISVIPCDQGPARTEPTGREEPETPFSISRAEPGFVKSNAELIDDLASATDMKPSTAICIRASIVFADSTSGGRNYASGMMTMSNGIVFGGRLGRNHMLSDVPNHYVRDRLMDYIDTQLEEDKRERARLAVFTDLNPVEIEQYSTLVMQWLKKTQPKSDVELMTLVTGDKPIKTDSERARVLDQALVLQDVYQEIDLTPKPGFSKRTYDRPGPIIYSVVEPGRKEPTPAEWNLDPGTDIDRDCDQIRAMIAIFVFQKEWTLDEFRLVLGNSIDRKNLSIFLDKYGPTKGNNTIFELSWEFFKRRELLGLPVTRKPKFENVPQELDNNSKKRSNTTTDGGKAREKRFRK